MSSFRSAWWVHIRVYADLSIWVHDEFLQECLMSAYTSVCRSDECTTSVWWVHTGGYDECIHECMQESWVSNECTMSSYRSVCWVHTRVYAGVMSVQWVHWVDTGGHDESIQECMQECLDEFMRSFCRSVHTRVYAGLMIVWWVHSGVHDECI